MSSRRDSPMCVWGPVWIHHAGRQTERQHEGGGGGPAAVRHTAESAGGRIWIWSGGLLDSCQTSLNKILFNWLFVQPHGYLLLRLSSCPSLHGTYTVSFPFISLSERTTVAETSISYNELANWANISFTSLWTFSGWLLNIWAKREPVKGSLEDM